MSEGQFQEKQEKKEIEFSIDDLTPIEHVMTGGSTDVTTPEGKKYHISYDNLNEIANNPETRELLFIPKNLLEGERKLPEVLEAREKSRIFYEYVSAFNRVGLRTYLERGIYPTFVPGKLDQNGRLENIDYYFAGNKERGIDKRKMLPEQVYGKLTLRDNFQNVFERPEAKDGIISLKVKNINK
jgi:hypothetical protein